MKTAHVRDETVDLARALYLVAGMAGVVLSTLLVLSMWFLPVGVVGMVLSVFWVRAARTSERGPTRRGRVVAMTTALVGLFGWWVIVATLNAQVGRRAWDSREYLPWMAAIALMTVTALVYLTRELGPAAWTAGRGE